MASRKPSTLLKGQKSASEDSQNSRNENSGNDSGTRVKAKSAGTIVKSRYLQTERKTMTKNSVLNESTFLPPRPASPRVRSAQKPRAGTPPRRSVAVMSDLTQTPMITSILDSSKSAGNVFQSTVLDGHSIHPDFDVSVIKVLQQQQQPPPPVEPETEKKILEMQTFLLTYITAKLEHSLKLLKEEAETDLLTKAEEVEQMRARVNEKKRQYHVLEKRKQLNSLLDLQITSLTPLAAAAEQFAQEYRSFATAIDTTRHELPVKNIHIEEDRGQFLDGAVVSLKESEQILQQYTRDIPADTEVTSECLKDMKNTAEDLSQQLHRGFSDVLELSSLVGRETVHIQQSIEEDKLGFTAAQNLYCA
ncbi:HAUS augmin-like complex subunit 8 [Chanos chanos]|uniref:HAUS augmin-like complex subunit 8 n=1 Tax=Chanos chanos TaxID=29144 RepID=A0A6J2W836_CHACN|nr:HAUS augmin-like complex subunit 8 [Chanos chanos]